MLFSSYQFLIFLWTTIVVLVLAGRVGQRTFLLTMIVCSLVFYGWLRADYTLILVGSAGVNFAIATGLEQNRSKVLFGFGLAFNLILLGVFKYADFVAARFRRLFRVLIAYATLSAAIARTACKPWFFSLSTGEDYQFNPAAISPESTPDGVCRRTSRVEIRKAHRVEVQFAHEMLRNNQASGRGAIPGQHVSAELSSTHFCWNMSLDSSAEPFVWTTT